MASDLNGSGLQDCNNQGGMPGSAGQQPVQGVLQMQPGMPYGLPGPSAMYPPTGPYLPVPHQNQNEQLRKFWKEQQEEIEQVGTDPAEFKNHQLPLARIKKIMKSDEDVRMISAEAPVLFAKACEIFILELTLRSWSHSEENKRRTLQRNDIAAAITRTDIFDFLVDIVPREERCDDGPRPMPQPMPSVAMPGMPGGAPMGYWPPQQQAQPLGGQVGAPAQGMAGPGADVQQQQQQQQMAITAAGQQQPGMDHHPSMMQGFYNMQAQQQQHQQQQALQQQQQQQQQSQQEHQQHQQAQQQQQQQQLQMLQQGH